METTPYTLVPPQEHPDTFYKVLDHLAIEIQVKAFLSLGNLLRTYQAQTASAHSEPGSLQECLTDVLVFGVLWNEHAGSSVASNRPVLFLLRQLEILRSRYPGQRRVIDPFKGRLLKYILTDKRTQAINADPKHLRFFLKWLRATGEYEYQAIRAERWITFVLTQDEKQSRDCLYKVLDFAAFFKRRAGEVLHHYTTGVDNFLGAHSEVYRNREDFFFTSRNEVEYHLNLVGGALLNKAMQKSFSATREKVIILPGCMRKSLDCKARPGKSGFICTACTPTCPVNLVNKKLSGRQAQVFIVPHSSGYKKSVNSLTTETTGYIGVACALNLLEGGLSLMERNIPAQCVYLDSPGCRKHWMGTGKCTQINLHRLESLMQQETESEHEFLQIQRTVA
ncbi:MAG: DUF116 domain-containing protein [Bacteroidales bacterium]